MCGFTGFISPHQQGNHAICRNMLDLIIHRGPDDEGIWVDADLGILLGHRRLSIQDISPLGHQPMVSEAGRYVIAYNGEVYNFNTLKETLKVQGYIFQGHSDTEVILAAFEAWGVEDSLQQFVGMFAFALWDNQERTLTLARDRMGEKPLYYGWQKNTFMFASELKALKAHPDWQGEIDRNALALYMRYNYIPSPHSIYQGINKLVAGEFIQLKVPVDSDQRLQKIKKKCYWKAKDSVESAINNPLNISDEEAVASLDKLLRNTIKEQMISDVPLGSFLSGGIDSSTVVAIMQQESSLPIKTFSIGFYECGYNEAEHAKAVSQHLKTEHTELYVLAEDAMKVIPSLSMIYDEPFADSSQIPTFLISKMAKQHVTVALTGDGGDELFAGYNRYFLGQKLWNKISRVPLPVRSLLSRGVTSIPPQSWDILGNVTGSLIPSLRDRTGDKLHKLAGVLAVGSSEEMYRNLISFWEKPESVVLKSCEVATAITDKKQLADLDDFTQRMQFLDSISYLPDDILTKVDRAGMAVSLETRIPFLDYRVFEFSWKIPMHQKIRDGQGKWLLRQVLYQYVPRSLLDRPKMGFGIPIDSWLRGPLKDWAEELLKETRLKEEGYFNVCLVRQKWDEHLSGKRNWQHHLWSVLMFQAWLENE